MSPSDKAEDGTPFTPVGKMNHLRHHCVLPSVLCLFATRLLRQVVLVFQKPIETRSLLFQTPV